MIVIESCYTLQWERRKDILAKKKEQESKPKRVRVPSNLVKIGLDRDTVKMAQDAAKLLAPQFDMPPQAAIEGTIKFAHEQAMVLKGQVEALQNAVKSQQAPHKDEIAEKVAAMAQAESSKQLNLFDESAVSYVNLTDEGHELVLE